MGFFDLKFIIIVLLSIVVYLMYCEIINIKYKVEKICQTNNIKIFNNKNMLDKIIEQTNDSSPPNLNKCFVKTIRIPLESLLNPNEVKNDKIIELLSSDIEIISPTNKLETIKEETDIDMTENKSYIDSSHIEVYSNDETNNEIISNNITLNESKIDYKNILKNLNKYKLPELQDLAIQFELPREVNNKKKTRNELIEEIKNYIVNKNV